MKWCKLQYMYLRIHFVFPAIALVVSFLLCFSASGAHAESVIWTTDLSNVPSPCEANPQCLAALKASAFNNFDSNSSEYRNSYLCSSLGFSAGIGSQGMQCYIHFARPTIQIQYKTQVTNADTGEVIACGSSVPLGTKLRYQTLPHVPEDVYWFTTGGSFDSPYGEWRANAAPPLSVQCLPKDYVFTAHYSPGSTDTADVYAPLTISSPAVTISGFSDFGCTDSTAESLNCAPDKAGTLAGLFTFQPTIGKFYTRETGDAYLHSITSAPACVGSNDPMTQFTSHYGASASTFNTAPFTLQVPAQQIACPITIVDNTGGPPTTPTLTDGGSCVVGQSHSITMTSTDPDNDQIHYGVDWNADGSIDEYVPPSGYVASGSTQTASRTYATAGTKTVKVLAQDVNGLSSGWATISFDCTDASAPPPPAGQCSDGIDNNGDGLIDMNDPNCIASGGASEFTFVPAGPPPSTTPDLTLTAIPSLVKKNATTQVNWSATNVSTCTTKGDNGDSWSGPSSPVGGNTSSPITKRAGYTLRCTDLSGNTLTKTAIVNILPTWRER